MKSRGWVSAQSNIFLVPLSNPLFRLENRLICQAPIIGCIFPNDFARIIFFLKFNLASKLETKSKGIFSLPLYPELKLKFVYKICKELKKSLNKI